MNNESTKYLFTELWQKFYSNNEWKIRYLFFYSGAIRTFGLSVVLE